MSVQNVDVKILCRKHFTFLEKDSGFQFVKGTQKYRLKYKSDSVGIVLDFDPREYYLFVSLCKLVDGEFSFRTGEILPSTVINCFDLDDVVTLRSRESLIPNYKSLRADEKISLDEIIKQQASNLQNFANDVLKADFSIFTELDKIVKRRAQEFAVKRFGEKASQYGWPIDKE